MPVYVSSVEWCHLHHEGRAEDMTLSVSMSLWAFLQFILFFSASIRSREIRVTLILVL